MEKDLLDNTMPKNLNEIDNLLTNLVKNVKINHGQLTEDDIKMINFPDHGLIHGYLIQTRDELNHCLDENVESILCHAFNMGDHRIKDGNIFVDIICNDSPSGKLLKQSFYMSERCNIDFPFDISIKYRREGLKPDAKLEVISIYIVSNSLFTK